MAKAVISTIGHDRPGFVSDITAIAMQLNLNIEDSRMTALGGEFAVLMAVDGSDADLAAFDNQLSALCSGKDLAYIYRRTRGQAAGSQAAQLCSVNVAALDHPGIVHAIAAFFSVRGINIRDLNTETSPAAHTGTPIFNVSGLAELPADIDVQEFKSEFEDFCAQQDLDGSLQPQ